jgi:hypothetical protein
MAGSSPAMTSPEAAIPTSSALDEIARHVSRCYTVRVMKSIFHIASVFFLTR